MKSGKKGSEKNKQYEKALGYLLSSLPMYQRDGGAAFKPGLDNTFKLLGVLGDPHQKFKAIHVAGTNGKGSVSHMLCAVLMKQGYKTGLYTSPHLLDFRERIRINGEKIKKSFVIDFVGKIKDLCEEIKPSFFEITVAMCFDYFASKKVEFGVIETGMGGRLDSTNVLLPVLSVITNIGREHTRYLGETLAEIAGEKAGIIKKDIPVIIGESHTETKPVFEEFSKQKDAGLHHADLYYSVDFKKYKNKKYHYAVLKEGKIFEPDLVTDLGGAYQVKNIATVYMALDVLKQAGVDIQPKNIRYGLEQVKKDTALMGRWDIKQKKPMVVLDTAHNAGGISEIKNQLALMKYKKLYIIFGMVNDKNPDEVLPVLPHKAFYFFTRADMPRSMGINELYKASGLYSLKGVTCANVKIACKFAMQMAGKEDLILITGSNFLVGEALQKVFKK